MNYTLSDTQQIIILHEFICCTTRDVLCLCDNRSLQFHMSKCETSVITEKSAPSFCSLYSCQLQTPWSREAYGLRKLCICVCVCICACAWACVSVCVCLFDEHVPIKGLSLFESMLVLPGDNPVYAQGHFVRSSGQTGQEG